MRLADVIFHVGQDAADYHHKAFAAHEASSLGAPGRFDIQFQSAYQRMRLHRLDREFDSALRRQMTAEEVYRRLTPACAALINARQAAELARLTRSPAWRKRKQRLHELHGGSVYLNTFMSPAEIAETRRIDAMPAMLALRAHQKSLHQKNQEMLNRWSAQFDDELQLNLTYVLRKVKPDVAANREARAPGLITIGRVGVGYADKYAYVAGGAIIKLQQGESSRMIAGGTSDAYAYMVGFAEGYRRLLDDHRRLLAFIAERSGKVQYEDGKLMFSSDADLTLARELFAKLEATRAELIALIERETKQEIDAERRQRGERVESAPKEQS